MIYKPPGIKERRKELKNREEWEKISQEGRRSKKLQKDEEKQGWNDQQPSLSRSRELHRGGFKSNRNAQY